MSDTELSNASEKARDGANDYSRRATALNDLTPCSSTATPDHPTSILMGVLLEAFK